MVRLAVRVHPLQSAAVGLVFVLSGRGADERLLLCLVALADGALSHMASRGSARSDFRQPLVQLGSWLDRSALLGCRLRPERLVHASGLIPEGWVADLVGAARPSSDGPHVHGCWCWAAHGSFQGQGDIVAMILRVTIKVVRCARLLRPLLGLWARHLVPLRSVHHRRRALTRCVGILGDGRVPARYLELEVPLWMPCELIGRRDMWLMILCRISDRASQRILASH